MEQQNRRLEVVCSRNRRTTSLHWKALLSGLLVAEFVALLRLDLRATGAYEDLRAEQNTLIGITALARGGSAPETGAVLRQPPRGGLHGERERVGGGRRRCRASRTQARAWSLWWMRGSACGIAHEPSAQGMPLDYLERTPHRPPMPVSGHTQCSITSAIFSTDSAQPASAQSWMTAMMPLM